MAYDFILDFFNNPLFFVFFFVLAFAVIGWFTGSFAVGGLSGFLFFVHITVVQEITILTNLLYIFMIAILFYTGFKMYGEAFSGGEVEA